MSEYGDFNNHIPTPQLDPLRVGEVMGSDAFSVGDWALLRTWENKPVKVTSLHQDLIFVDRGRGESLEGTLANHYPSELGYPLDHRFWSLHQKKSYLRCHFDRRLLKRWEKTSKVFDHISDVLKAFLVGAMVSIFALMIFGFWSYNKISGRLNNVFNNSSSQ
ncbi:hypothetical protein [Acaryochloris sp. CCMEE 5410]|uniref:hypothetical protein n=1 Tax=Acaryochloris sp. CCMEE 5410 TaxID=310037 RepID=UPI000585B31B|nr:hypothetical protein [Acaryochloris sp. CCMEE 5410]KAI9129640.1 hypothetical protein ON05_033675 [Acaryochloris sp. CCMEE 5410]